MGEWDFGWLSSKLCTLHSFGCLNAKSRSNAEVSNEKVAELLNLRDDAPDKII